MLNILIKVRKVETMLPFPDAYLALQRSGIEFNIGKSSHHNPRRLMMALQMSDFNFIF